MSAERVPHAVITDINGYPHHADDPERSTRELMVELIEQFDDFTALEYVEIIQNGLPVRFNPAHIISIGLQVGGR